MNSVGVLSSLKNGKNTWKSTRYRGGKCDEGAPFACLLATNPSIFQHLFLVSLATLAILITPF